MTLSPTMTFCIPGAVGSIGPDSPLWHLSLSGQPSEPGDKARGRPPGITIGDYFMAAAGFLLDNGCSILKKAFQDKTGTPFCSPPHPVRISLSLEKHGAFYHPIKAVVSIHDDARCALVLNGAVFEPGLTLIETEYHLLSETREHIPRIQIPRVYGRGCVSSSAGDVGFFMGEWFEGFHEFHAHINEGELCIHIWKDENCIQSLSMDDAFPIYQNISYLLTLAYNMDTGEEIYPWHHAAGDFIVNPKNLSPLLKKGGGVRLITMRGYSALTHMEGGQSPGAARLTRLMFFFLNLSLRMQLDRLDGVGETVFLGPGVLAATLSGFLTALGEKTEDISLISGFVKFISGFSLDQLISIMGHLVGIQGNPTREAEVIQTHLGIHCSHLYRLLKTAEVSDFY